MIESSSFQMPQSQPEMTNLPKHWPSCELESHSLHSRFPMLLPNPPEPGNDICPHSSATAPMWQLQNLTTIQVPSELETCDEMSGIMIASPNSCSSSMHLSLATTFS